MLLYLPRDDELPAAPHPVLSHGHFRRIVTEAVAASPRFRLAETAERADLVVFQETDTRWQPHAIDDMAQRPLIRAHAGKCITLKCLDLPIVLFPGFYDGLSTKQQPFLEHAAFPYLRTAISELAPPARAPDTLWYFRGLLRTHAVRRRLYDLWHADPRGSIEATATRWGAHAELEKAHFMQGIAGARFSLCPRGRSPSSHRIYESMQLGTAPVIISDHWVAPEGLPWDSIAVRVAQAEITRLPAILEAEGARAEDLGAGAQAVWRDKLAPDRIGRFYLERLERFVDQRFQPRRFDELYDLWTSSAFRRAYGLRRPAMLRQHAANRLNHLLWLVHARRHGLPHW